jgi:hypothetical protein
MKIITNIRSLIFADCEAYGNLEAFERILKGEK